MFVFHSQIEVTSIWRRTERSQCRTFKNIKVTKQTLKTRKIYQILIRNYSIVIVVDSIQEKKSAQKVLDRYIFTLHLGL